MNKKTVLITGASTGFGLDTARVFAEKGWNVAATMRSPDAFDDAALRAHPDVLVTPLDVKDEASITGAIERTAARFGSIDAVINNAGFGLFGLFEATPRARIEEQFAVNVFGAMDVTRAVLPYFRAQKSGAVVNVSSGAGVFGLPMLSLYTASKHALEGWSESLSYELGSLGVRVKLIEPGGVVSTNFGARSGAEAAQVEPIADYAPFVAHTLDVFARLRESRRTATSRGVADVIFAATTDPSDRLRYVATEDIKPLLEARWTFGEEAYMAKMRADLAPKK